MTRTECDTKSGAGADKIVLELVVQRTESKDEDVEEDPNGEEHPPSSFVDHPDGPFLPPATGLIRSHLNGRSGVRALQALKPPALGLVALQMTGVGRKSDIAHVRVLLQRRHLAIGEVETRGTLGVV